MIKSAAATSNSYPFLFAQGSFQDPNMYIQIPLQAALEKAFAQHLDVKLDDSSQNGAGFDWRVRFKFFPHPSLTSASVAGQIAPVFILASLMFNFVMALTSVVSRVTMW